MKPPSCAARPPWAAIPTSRSWKTPRGAAARALGYSEIITYSFVSPSSFDAIRLPADSPLRKTVKLVNPLGEDTSIMRTVILPSMLDILSRNYAFKNKGVKLYEIGKIYLPVEGQKLPDEPKRMIFGTYGEHENFFTLKGEIDALLEQLNVHPAAYIADTKNPSYHPGRCADIIIDGKKLGVIGQIHPLVAEAYGIDGEVYVAELDFTGLQAALAPERVSTACPGSRPSAARSGAGVRRGDDRRYARSLHQEGGRQAAALHPAV
ncbi:MAG: hypothetical protein ACLU3I_18895 [Acutalibacteraceae bacterium]